MEGGADGAVLQVISKSSPIAYEERKPSILGFSKGRAEHGEEKAEKNINNATTRRHFRRREDESRKAAKSASGSLRHSTLAHKAQYDG